MGDTMGDYDKTNGGCNQEKGKKKGLTINQRGRYNTLEKCENSEISKPENK